MEGDRWASLVSSLVARSPDFFEKINPRDPRHLVREQLTLRAVEQRNYVEMFKVWFHKDLSDLERYEPSDDAEADAEYRTQLFERLTDVLKVLRTKLFPYWKWDTEENDKLDVDIDKPQSWRDAYEAAFDVDLDSDDFKTRLAAVTTPATEDDSGDT